jgi:hypothetical protein
VFRRLDRYVLIGRSRRHRHISASTTPPYACDKPIYLGDDSFSNQSACKNARRVGRYLFVRKSASHPLIQGHLTGAAQPIHTHRVKQARDATRTGSAGQALPLHDGTNAMTFNWLEIEIRHTKSSAATTSSLIRKSSRTTFLYMAAFGYAQWMMESKIFNILNTIGCYLVCNPAHDQQRLAALLITLNLRALAFRSICHLAVGPGELSCWGPYVYRRPSYSACPQIPTTSQKRPQYAP